MAIRAQAEDPLQVLDVGLVVIPPQLVSLKLTG
jgi:hypothetical protein